LIDLLTYITPSIGYLDEQFTTIITDYLREEEQVETIKFSCLLVFLLFVFVVIWIPYHSSLSKQIWRTKGMLNMIPLDVI
jgi:hypothetical protein